MCLRFVFLLITRLAAWLRLSRREETWKMRDEQMVSVPTQSGAESLPALAAASSASTGRPAIDAKRRGPYTERRVHAGADSQPDARSSVRPWPHAPVYLA